MHYPLKGRPEILICFAVKVESRFFRQGRRSVSLLHTGIGWVNAEAALQSRLARSRPELIIASGFAGGLNPALQTHALLFERSGAHPLFDRLSGLSFREGTFHCQDRIAITAVEKQSLWRSTQRDAVEMESASIRRICHEHGIPCLVLRAISDTVYEDLPLDFNRLMTSRMTVGFAKLCGELCRSPARLPALVRFHRSIDETAWTLAGALSCLLDG